MWGGVGESVTFLKIGSIQYTDIQEQIADLLVNNGNKTLYTHVDHCHLVISPILWICVCTATPLHDFNILLSIGVYDLNGKGCLTGCDLHGYSLVSILFKPINPIYIYSCVFFNTTFLLSFQVFLFVGLLFCSYCVL